LLAFATEESLEGQKPATWWQKCHDIDLLWGVQKYGFGNYHLMREDRKLTWYDVKAEEKQWPEVERITKRLKKIIHLVRNCEDLRFDGIKIENSKTGLSINNKIEVIV